MVFRRRINRPFFVGAVWLASIATCGADERPNVLLIITDDQNDYLAEASEVDVQTPAFDRLRRQAINFRHAYCASPVCGPSRAALFSGLYPHHTGAYLNGADPWRKSQPLDQAETLPELFRRSGYFTWGMGKLFHAKLPDHRAGDQWDNRASPNGGFGPFADKDHRFAGKFFSVQEWDRPDDDFPDVRSANAAVEFLRNRSSSQPFLMVYGLWRPHNPWTAPRRFFDRYEASEIDFPPPGYAVDDLQDIPADGQRLAAIFGERWDGFGDANRAAWRRILHGYLACTSFADWNVGRVLDALDEAGLDDETIVIVTSDNGYHVGEKHHYGKSTLWEKSARVPLLIRLPDGRHAGASSDAAVGLIDLYPTLRRLCDLAAPPQTLDGRDLSPLLGDPEAPWPHPAITTYGEGRFSLRSGPWRYIRYADGTEELYDHRRDPHEFDNLADRPEHENLKSSFRKSVPTDWAPSLGGRKG
ncbi:MAG: sulfatase [Planctomycetota bacterium]